MHTAKLTRALATIFCSAWLGLLNPVAAQEPITPEQFEKVHKLLKPQPGESRWREIAWETSLWEARRKAAAEGKPIAVWTGSGGAPACHT